MGRVVLAGGRCGRGGLRSIDGVRAEGKEGTSWGWGSGTRTRARPTGAHDRSGPARAPSPGRRGRAIVRLRQVPRSRPRRTPGSERAPAARPRPRRGRRGSAGTRYSVLRAVPPRARPGRSGRSGRTSGSPALLLLGDVTRDRRRTLDRGPRYDPARSPTRARGVFAGSQFPVPRAVPPPRAPEENRASPGSEIPE